MPGGFSTPTPINSSHPIPKDLDMALKDVDRDLRRWYRCMKQTDENKYFEPILYQTQVVAGLNYKVTLKVKAKRQSSESNGQEFIYVLIFQPLPYLGKPCELVTVSLRPF
ncbi:hypothetical protein EC968_009919 [Mortierella alpina]|nr:hypothetical protein EC968_009919 [Mortierella alpina]